MVLQNVHFSKLEKCQLHSQSGFTTTLSKNINTHKYVSILF